VSNFTLLSAKTHGLRRKQMFSLL